MSDNPHRMVAALLGAVLDKISLAKAVRAGDPAGYIGHLDTAIFIIDGLRASLNPTAGGKVARHLADLYRYIEGRLTDARSCFDLQALDEVEPLLSEIRGAWQAIGDGAAMCAKGSPVSSLSLTNH